VARSLRHRRHRFTTRVSDIDFTVTDFALVPVTKVPCGPEKQSFSRDRWLVVVTVVVLCPLRICVISNGHLPITFLGLFVTLDR
jgi:hypothetical protein